jgi:hypothetical protein
MSTELACGAGNGITLNQVGETGYGEGSGNTEQSAKNDARNKGEADAVKLALKRTEEYLCPDGCPLRYYDLTFSKPTTSVPVQVDDTYFSTGYCEWSGRFWCAEKEDHKTRKSHAQSQDFDCDDDWTIIFEDYLLSYVIDLPPAGPVEAAQRMTELQVKSGLEIRRRAGMAVNAYRCPLTCEKKNVRLLVWPQNVHISQPDPQGKVAWKAYVWVRVEVKCGVV